MKIKIKRIYDAPAEDDGKRILVDRLWPRGISKDKAKIDYWAKDIAPSNELRKWYQHDPEKWEEFKDHYLEELDANQTAVMELRTNMDETTTFLFSAKETKLNNAHTLKAYLLTLPND